MRSGVKTPQHEALGKTLRDALGPGFGIGTSDPRLDYGGLWPAEETATPRMVPKRLREFTAGRHAARIAMSDLGLPAAAIPMGTDRAPVWPAGLIGSIAHCDTACIAAVARSETCHMVGLDIEEATPLDAELWETVLTPNEHKWISTQGPDEQGLLAKQIFCAKEATYKSQYPTTKIVLDFQDVEISRGTGSFSAHIGGHPAGSGQLKQTGVTILALHCALHNETTNTRC